MPSVGRYHRNIFLEKKRYQSAIMQRSDLGNPSYIIDADFRDWADITLRKNQRALQDLFNVLDPNGNVQPNLAVIGHSWKTISPQDAALFPNLTGGTTLERDTEPTLANGNANPNFGTLVQVPNVDFNFVLGGFRSRDDSQRVVDSPEHSARAYVGGFSATLFDDTDFRCLNKTGEFSTDLADGIHRKWTRVALNTLEDDRALFHVEPSNVAGQPGVGFYKRMNDAGRPAYITLYNGVYKIVDNTETTLTLENFNPEVKPTLDQNGVEQGTAISIPPYTGTSPDGHRYYFIRVRYNAAGREPESVSVLLDVHLEDHGMEEDLALNHNPGGSPLEGMRRNKLIQQVVLHFPDPFDPNGTRTPTPDVDYTDLGGVRHYVRSIGRIVIRADAEQDPQGNPNNGNAPGVDDPDGNNPDVIFDGEEVGGGGAGGSARYYVDRCFSIDPETGVTGARGQAPSFVGLDLDRATGVNRLNENIFDLTNLNFGVPTGFDTLRQVAQQPEDLAERIRRSDRIAVVGPGGEGRNLHLQSPLIDPRGNGTLRSIDEDNIPRRTVHLDPIGRVEAMPGEYIGITGIQAALDCGSVREVYVRPGTYYIDNLKQKRGGYAESADGRPFPQLYVPSGKTLRLDTNAFILYHQAPTIIPTAVSGQPDQTSSGVKARLGMQDAAIILGSGARIIGGNLVYAVAEGYSETISVDGADKHYQANNFIRFAPRTEFNLGKEEYNGTVEGDPVSEVRSSGPVRGTIGGGRYVQRSAGVYGCRISCGYLWNGTFANSGTRVDATSLRTFETLTGKISEDPEGQKAIFDLRANVAGEGVGSAGHFEIQDCVIRAFNTQILMTGRNVDDFSDYNTNITLDTLTSQSLQRRAAAYNLDAHSEQHSITIENNNIAYFWNILSRHSPELQTNAKDIGDGHRGFDYKQSLPSDSQVGLAAAGGARYAAFVVKSHAFKFRDNIVSGNNTCMYLGVHNISCDVSNNAFKAIPHYPHKTITDGTDLSPQYADVLQTAPQDQHTSTGYVDLPEQVANLPISWAGPFMVVMSDRTEYTSISENVFRCGLARSDNGIPITVDRQYLTLPDHMIFITGLDSSRSLDKREHCKVDIESNYIEFGLRGITFDGGFRTNKAVSIVNNDLFEVGRSLYRGGAIDTPTGDDLAMNVLVANPHDLRNNNFYTLSRLPLKTPIEYRHIVDGSLGYRDASDARVRRRNKDLPPLDMAARTAIAVVNQHVKSDLLGESFTHDDRGTVVSTLDVNMPACIRGNGLYLQSKGSTGVFAQGDVEITHNMLVNKSVPDPRLGAAFGSIGIIANASILPQFGRNTVSPRIDSNRIHGFNVGVLTRRVAEGIATASGVSYALKDPAAPIVTSTYSRNNEVEIAHNSAFSLRHVALGFASEQEFEAIFSRTFDTLFPRIVTGEHRDDIAGHTTPVVISNNIITDGDMGIISNARSNISRNSIYRMYRFGVFNAVVTNAMQLTRTSGNGAPSVIKDNHISVIGMGAAMFIRTDDRTIPGNLGKVHALERLFNNTVSLRFPGNNRTTDYRGEVDGEFIQQRVTDSSGKYVAPVDLKQGYSLAISPVWGSVRGRLNNAVNDPVPLEFRANISAKYLDTVAQDFRLGMSRSLTTSELDSHETVFDRSRSAHQKIGFWFSGIVNFDGGARIEGNEISSVASSGILEVISKSKSTELVSTSISKNTISGCTEGITTIAGTFSQDFIKNYKLRAGIDGGFIYLGLDNNCGWNGPDLVLSDGALQTDIGDAQTYNSTVSITHNEISSTTFHAISIVPRVLSVPSISVYAGAGTITRAEVCNNTIRSNYGEETGSNLGLHYNAKGTHTTCGQAIYAEACTDLNISNNNIAWFPSFRAEPMLPKGYGSERVSSTIFQDFYDNAAGSGGSLTPFLSYLSAGLESRKRITQYDSVPAGIPVFGSPDPGRMLTEVNIGSRIVEGQQPHFKRPSETDLNSSNISFLGLPNILDLLTGAPKFEKNVGVISGFCVAAKHCAEVTFSDNKITAKLNLGSSRLIPQQATQLALQQTVCLAYDFTTVQASGAESETILNSRGIPFTDSLGNDLYNSEPNFFRSGAVGIRQFFFNNAVSLTNGITGFAAPDRAMDSLREVSADGRYLPPIDGDPTRSYQMSRAQMQSVNNNRNLRITDNTYVGYGQGFLDIFGGSGAITVKGNTVEVKSFDPEMFTLREGRACVPIGSYSLDQMRTIRICRGAPADAGDINISTAAKYCPIKLGVFSGLGSRFPTTLTLTDNTIMGAGIFADMLPIVSPSAGLTGLLHPPIEEHVIQNNTLNGFGINYSGGSCAINSNSVSVYGAEIADDRVSVSFSGTLEGVTGGGKLARFTRGRSVRCIGQAPAQSAIWVSEPIFESQDPRYPILFSNRSLIPAVQLTDVGVLYGVFCNNVKITNNNLSVQPMQGQMLVNSVLANALLGASNTTRFNFPYHHLDAYMGRAAGIFAGVGDDAIISGNTITSNVRFSRNPDLSPILPLASPNPGEAQPLVIPSTSKTTRSTHPGGMYTGSIGILIGHLNARSKKLSQTGVKTLKGELTALNTQPFSGDGAEQETIPVGSAMDTRFMGRRGAGTNIMVANNTLGNSSKIVMVTKYGAKGLIKGNTLQLGLTTPQRFRSILNRNNVVRIHEDEEIFISEAGDSNQALIYLLHENYSTPIVSDYYTYFRSSDGYVAKDRFGNEIPLQGPTGRRPPKWISAVTSGDLASQNRPAAINVVGNHIEPTATLSRLDNKPNLTYPFDSTWERMFGANGMGGPADDFDRPIYGNQYLGYIFTSCGRSYPFMRRWNNYSFYNLLNVNGNVQTFTSWQGETLNGPDDRTQGNWPPLAEEINAFHHVQGLKASYDALEPLFRANFPWRGNQSTGLHSAVDGGRYPLDENNVPDVPEDDQNNPAENRGDRNPLIYGGPGGSEMTYQRCANGIWANVMNDAVQPKPVVFTEAELSLSNIAVLPMTFGGRGPSRVGIETDREVANPAIAGSFNRDVGGGMTAGPGETNRLADFYRGSGKLDFRYHDFNLMWHSSFSGHKGTPADLLEIYNSNLRYYGPPCYSNTAFLSTGYYSRVNFPIGPLSHADTETDGNFVTGTAEHRFTATRYIDVEDVLGQDQFRNGANRSLIDMEDVQQGPDAISYSRVIDSYGYNIPAGYLPFHNEVAWMDFGISRYVLPTIPLHPTAGLLNQGNQSGVIYDNPTGDVTVEFYQGSANNTEAHPKARFGPPGTANTTINDIGLEDLLEFADRCVPTYSLDHFFNRFTSFGVPLHFYAYRPEYKPTNDNDADRMRSTHRVAFWFPANFITGHQTRESQGFNPFIDAPGNNV